MRTSLVARYYRVVDALFSRKLLDARPSLILLTLRYLPSFEGESQIAISKNMEGEYVVTSYSLPRGSERIGEQVGQISAALGIEDPVEIAKHIKVKVRKVDVPSRVVSELVRRYDALRMSADLDMDPASVIIDPTVYQLSFRIAGTVNEFYVSFPASDFGHDQKAHPLVRWMNEVKRVVEKYGPTE